MLAIDHEGAVDAEHAGALVRVRVRLGLGLGLGFELGSG